MNKKMNTLEKVKGFMNSLSFPVFGCSLVVGLSGGSDSTALLLILKELSSEYDWKLTAVHVDHGIRPAADRLRDLEFCRNLSEELKIPFFSFTEDIPAYAKERHLSLETAGRIRRYELLESVRLEQKADMIVTAHHLDDQEETILLHLFRGSGLKGLCGMEPYDPQRKLLRPLLEIRKKELEEFLACRGQSYVTDETNFETDAVRNRIRHQVLPAIRDALPEYSGGNAAKNVRLFREMEQEYTERAENWIHAHLVKKVPGELIISLWEEGEAEPSLPLRTYIVRECIRSVSGSLTDVGEVHLSAIRDLMEGGTGRKQIWPGRGEAVRSYNTLIFYQRESFDPEGTGAKDLDRENADLGTEDQENGNRDKKDCRNADHGNTESLSVRLREADEKEKEVFLADPVSFSQNTCFQYVDYDKIVGSLWIRTRLPGDVFATSGDGRRKKLQDVLVDLKVPAAEREKLLLVGLGNHEVVWIPGRRLSPLYFVRPETVRIGRLEIFDPGKEQHEGSELYDQMYDQ